MEYITDIGCKKYLKRWCCLYRANHFFFNLPQIILQLLPGAFVTGLCPIWKSLYHLSVFFQTSEAVPEELMGERFGLCRVAVGKSDKTNVMLHIEIRVLPAPTMESL